MSSDPLADLKVVAVVAAVPLALLLSGAAAESILRPVLVAPLLTVVPGYAVLAALLPASGPLSRSGDADRIDGSRGDGERSVRDRNSNRPETSLTGVAWWIGTLVVGVLVVAALARALLATSVKYDAESILVGVAIIVGAGLAAAAVRRSRRPPARRYRANPRAWTGGASDLFRTDDAGDVVLSVALAASVLLLVGGAGYALTAGHQGPEYTEFYLTSQNGSEDVAGSYPTDLGPGETADLTAGVVNHEGQTETYTVVVEIQRVENRTDDAAVLERREVTRMEATVAEGETWRARHSLDVPFYADHVRVRYYLYRGDAPADPGPESAYRHMEHWLSSA